MKPVVSEGEIEREHTEAVVGVGAGFGFPAACCPPLGVKKLRISAGIALLFVVVESKS